MQRLNLPEFEANIIKEKGQEKIMDIVRKKYVALTPEEWVRQHVIHYFGNYLNVPYTLMAVEKAFTIGNVSKRFDIAVYTSKKKPVLLSECKSPDVPISQKVFDQAAVYNMKLHVDYLFVTNGLTHFGGKIDYQNQRFKFLNALPDYNEMIDNGRG
ncbi:MAG: type I restriction enzyme HsdR N-terminal domain-containing protein [Bacteroidales bacterium]|nr:type I restriction enzyme HsdR N-terminal domain-containing protein [Bacteroidales bacterium]MCF8337031.1 type I restriction enzyme HsdR N-terminal domain-containing protein [Bacteroidales bacterium]